MEKCFCVILAIILLLSFAGCRKSNINNVSSETEQSSQSFTSEDSNDIANVESAEEISSAPIQESAPDTSSESATPNVSRAMKNDSETQKAPIPDTVSEYVKTTMDACEQANIEYVDFMKSVSVTNPDGSVVIMDYMGDAAMAAKEKYINICSNMWKIRNMDLSPADRAYYNEVAARIDKKYAELNQNQ